MTVRPSPTPSLPVAVAFPTVGSEMSRRFFELGRGGKFLFGLNDAGGETIWNVETAPHALLIGRCGQGKSSALRLPLTAALSYPDLYNVVLIDRHATPGNWLAESALATYATNYPATLDALAGVMDSAHDRFARLAYRGATSWMELRHLYDEHPDWELEDGPAPKRILLAIDGVADLLSPADHDATSSRVDPTVRAKASALFTSIEILGDLGIHLVATSLNTDEPSSVLRTLLSLNRFHLTISEYIPDTRRLLLADDRSRKFPDPHVPRGRAWAVDAQALTQIMYLPWEEEPCPWDRDIALSGAYNIVTQFDPTDNR